MNKKWRCRLLRHFFGLSDRYIQSVYEQIFQMKYHGGWSFFELYNLPITIRNWFYNRLVEQKNQEAEAQEKAQNS